MATRKFVDIGANLTDRMYQGVYQGSKKHEPDLIKVVERSVANGLDKVCRSSELLFSEMMLKRTNQSKPPNHSESLQTQIFITSGNVTDFNESIELIESFADKKDLFYTTIGCHPTRCLEFTEANDEGESYLNQLEQLYLKFKDRIVAFGELGLDYDRLKFCPKEVQLK